ncbi:hypothetical protein [Maioricimonas rarisocia]|uniref:hypothetical protein n=1 Tax=Maioricimonas rarisocia TaxID=2528026 RepID=UPI0011A93075|nr:hypothetical protein [Maioricimonas rarisocia]
MTDEAAAMRLGDAAIASLETAMAAAREQFKAGRPEITPPPEASPSRDLEQRLDLAEHTLSQQQRKMFRHLRDMKPQPIKQIATAQQTDEAAQKMLQRIEKKLLIHSDLQLALDIKSGTVTLRDLGRK